MEREIKMNYSNRDGKTETGSEKRETNGNSSEIKKPWKGGNHLEGSGMGLGTG